MMNTDLSFWLPALLGLGGALIGAGASVVTVMIQARNERKKNRTSLIADLAIKETNEAFRRLRELKKSGTVQPPVVYMHYYDQILRAIDEGNFDGEAFRVICKDNKQFVQLTNEIDAAADAEDEGNDAFKQENDH